MSSIIAKETAKRITDIRVQKRLRAEDVAERAGIKRSTYYRYEAGDIKNVKLDKIRAIAEALEVHPAEIIVWGEESDQPAASNLTQARMELMKEVDGMTEEEIYHLLDVIRAVKGVKG